jgi:hypothetical protein
VNAVAVTTRSHLRAVRFLPSMLVATLRVRRQLVRAGGVVRWASVIAGPREFWTVTVWSSRHAMQEFMRSDAHGDVMWSVGRWLDSFWLMRWRPGSQELGSWDGLAVSRLGGATERDLVLEHLAALGGGEDVRAPRFRIEYGGGAVLRLPLGPRALAGLLALRRRLRRDERLLRVALGIGNRRELFLFAVWTDREPAAALVDSDWARATAARYGGRAWAHAWEPENELGHWDGMRLRVAARYRSSQYDRPRYERR